MKTSIFVQGLKAAGCYITLHGKTRMTAFRIGQRGRSATINVNDHHIQQPDIRTICKQLGIDPRDVGARSCR